ncbi:MAG: NFACT RNA binding domain-containing protein [Clostridiales bacterium]
MAYDGLVMRGITQECNKLLTGGRVDKVTQPNKNEIILHIRSQGKNHKLLLSALAQEARIHLTSTTAPNPDQPPVFCMVLRKHLEGGRVLSFEQQGLDRILYINIQSLDEFGDLKEKRLIAEIMGKHSNLILVDPEKGRIIDSLRRITAAVSRFRQVLPGEQYLPPPSKEKLPLWLETEEAIAGRLMAAGLSKALDQVILSTYDGLGPLSAQELIHRAGKSPVDTLEYFGQADYLRLFQSIASLGGELQEGIYQPEIYFQSGQTSQAGQAGQPGQFSQTVLSGQTGTPKDFSAIALTLYPEKQRQRFSSLNEMLDAYFRGRGTANLFRQKQSDLEQIIRREQERCRKKAGLQAEAVLEGQEAQKWQLYGQLLMASHYQLKQGPEAVVTDFYDPEGKTVNVPMDPQLSPLENAQAYFHRYQKARQKAEKAQIYYEETMEELAYLDSLALSLTTVTGLPELAEVRGELQEAGYIKSADKEDRQKGGRNKNVNKKTGAKNAGSKAADKAKEPSLGSLSYEGFTILYGHNNRQNDYLTMKVAKSGDLWLHAQKIPSSHVIIRNPDKLDIPEQVIEAAAKICLWHSQAKTAGRTAVDFAKRQNVWKPKGAKPGMVLYEQYQTIYVSTDEEEIGRLLS